MADKSKNKKYQGKGRTHKGVEKNPKEDAKDKKKSHHENQSYKGRQSEENFGKPNSIVEEPVDTLTLFANLKRETDEILKITEGAKNKYSKREITSNWSKYELPSDNYEIVENQEHGADYEELLHMPVSQGGHFQFKHEKAWTSDTKDNEFKDLYTLNLNYISSALYCVPFYERNNLDPDLFPKEQRERMANTASRNMGKFKKNLPVDRPEKTITDNLLEKLKEPGNLKSESNEKYTNSNMGDVSENDAEDDELERMLVGDTAMISLNDATDGKPNIPSEQDEHSMYDFSVSDLIIGSTKSEEKLVFAKVPSDYVRSPEKSKLLSNDYDNELDEILGIKPPEITTPKVKKEEMIQQSSAVKTEAKDAPPKPITGTKMDLDKWLDDYLDS